MLSTGIVGRLVVVPVVACVALVSTTGATASTVTPCPQQFGSLAAGSWPSACWRPYGPDSPFNKLLPADPKISPESGAIVADMMRLKYHFEGGGSRFDFTSWGRGAVYYAQPSDPMVKVNCTALWGANTCQGDNGVVVDGMSIHVPGGAQPAPGSDHHLTVVDQANDVEYDFELASFSADRQTLTVAAASQIPIGPDQGAGLGAQSTAAHFSTIAGLIREPELAAGAINHALVVSIPCTEGSVSPAQGPWGYACSQMGQSRQGGEIAPHLGTLFQLKMTDAQIAASGAPAWEQAIMTAMAHYGMYANDTNGPGDPDSFELEKEADVSYTSLGAQPPMADLLKSLPGSTYWAPSDIWIASGPTIDFSRLRVIDPCVAQGTCPPSGQRPAHAALHHSPKAAPSCRRARPSNEPGRHRGQHHIRRAASCVRSAHHYHRGRRKQGCVRARC